MASNMSDTCLMGLNESVDENLSFLDMELEALQSIYINELEVKADEKCTTVSIDLHPSTADKLDEQYVRMTLQFLLEEEYPEKTPDIKIRNPRGLSDEKLNSIVQDLLMIAESKKGNSMLFEMIDAAKEHLTVGNRPSGECAICLHGFSDSDVFTKTECYHYFHSHCLARYAKNFTENYNDSEAGAKSKTVSNELLCPMCRIPIQFNAYDVDYPPPEESDDNFTLTEEIKELQKKMADLYQKQVEKGGIIDVEAEKNKYLIEISNVPTRVNHEERSEQKLSMESDSATDSKVEPSDETNDLSSERKEHTRDYNQKSDYRGKNRNFNRPHENRSNYRHDNRYNRQSYDNYRSNYNRNKYGKQNSSSYRRREDSDIPHDRTEDSSVSHDLGKSEDVSNSQDVQDNVSETSEQPSPGLKSKQNSNYSPRYNRGYRHGGGNYGNYHNNRRSDKFSYHERHSSQISRRYSAMRGEEPSPSKSEERGEADLVTVDDGDGHKRNYRSGSYKRDDDYYPKQRYSDSRNNSQRGYKGAYNRRDNYSNVHNNYSRNSRYGDSRDREQYSDRDRNYREKRTYRDDKYRASGDTYDRYNKQGTRNYSGSRPGRYSDKSYAESSNNESESVELSSHGLNTDSNTLENENSSIPKHPESSGQENRPPEKNDGTHLDEKCSDKLTEAVPALDSGASNVFPGAQSENSHVTSRTVNPPPGFANPFKKVIYGLQGANPPPGFNRS